MRLVQRLMTRTHPLRSPPRPEPADQRPIALPQGRAAPARDENARLAVLRAADDLLAERGFSGVTIEGIAARAGVAKQTIYRWWPSKVDILLDALAEDAARQRRRSPRAAQRFEATRRYLHALARFLTRIPPGRSCWR